MSQDKIVAENTGNPQQESAVPSRRSARSSHSAVWGIDVGNCSLKALRCYVDDNDPTRLVADAIDYIEYPQMLTQAGARPDELIREALKQFIARNSLRGDKLAISIAGQNGFVRFIKLPPMPAKKIPDIVHYEAKQQIPFPLADVIWDYQRLGNQGNDAFGMLEVEIGLFSIKRDQMAHILEPYEDLDIPLDLVQLGPLALYNYMMKDELKNLPSADEYDAENPPPYIVVLSMGTDATDLILTNGFHIWQRNLPIGGNHFTRALVKDLNLTFAKADHLKRNLTSSQDKIAVLRAMQPVFNSFQNEIQRSLGYYSSLDPNAQYERVIALGNSMRLTGLTKYLSQSLGIPFDLGTSFPGLDTSKIVERDIVREYLPSYGICYGLCIQGLKQASISTNFIPSEIRMTRIINAKKPWAVAAMSLLLFGAAFNYGAHVGIQGTVEAKKWLSAESSASSVAATASENATKVTTAETAIETVDKFGEQLVDHLGHRFLWQELLRGINECLPVPSEQDPKDIPNADSIRQREELHIVNIEAQRLDDATAELWLHKMVDKGWFTVEQRKQLGVHETEDSATEPSTDNLVAVAFGGSAVSSTATGAADSGTEMPVDAGAADSAVPMDDGTSMDGASAESGASSMEEGTGPERWIISVSGYHFHNGKGIDRERADFVRDTFIRNIQEKSFELPKPVLLSKADSSELVAMDEDAEPAAESVSDAVEQVTMAELGVLYPVLVDPGTPKATFVSNPYKTSEKAKATTLGGRGARKATKSDDAAEGAEGEEELEDDIEQIPVDRFDFVVHFVWEPKTPSDRERIRNEAARRAAAEKAARAAEENIE